MAYKISELLNVLRNASNEGYDYVEIYDMEGDDEIPANLIFDVFVDSIEADEFETIESVEVPKDYCCDSPKSITPDEAANSLCFSFEEICTLMNAVDNSLEYAKIRSKSPDCTKEESADIKELSIDFRNMQAKFAKFRKKYGIKTL